MLSNPRLVRRCIFCTSSAPRPSVKPLLPCLQNGDSFTQQAWGSAVASKKKLELKGKRFEAHDGRWSISGPHRPTSKPTAPKYLRSPRPMGREQRAAIVKSPKLFKQVVSQCLRDIEGDVLASPGLKNLGISKPRARVLWEHFKRDRFADIDVTVDSKRQVSAEQSRRALRQDLTRAMLQTGHVGLKYRLKHAFFDWLLADRFTPSDLEKQQAVADLRYPSEWSAGSRNIQRTIHIHVGPTNSGKTYNALKRLEETGHGIYAGPLRLLAHEVYSKLLAKGFPACLLTGEERRFPTREEVDKLERTSTRKIDPNLPIISSTVEMVPLMMPVPVAILDEIQMMGDPERGWAWTQAFLDLQAEEIHVCGEVRAVPLIKELAASVGDKVEVHHYARLSPLHVESQSLGSNLNKLQKGDCVISFSVAGIQQLKRQIEKATKKNVAMIYGTLPPEIRAQQARLFNDPDNDYDFLVASNAIGMGLNLSIKRVVFESTAKFNGYEMRPLEISDLKQIGGRAGRYKVAHEAIHTPKQRSPEPVFDLNDGFTPTTSEDTREESDSAVDTLPILPAATSTGGSVTCLEDFDLAVLAQAFETEAEPLTQAGIRPPNAMVERFAQYFPKGTPFAYLLQKLYDTVRLHKSFILCQLKDHIPVADTLEAVEELSLNERNVMSAIPLPPKDRKDEVILRSFGRAVASNSGGGLLDLEGMNLGLLEEEAAIDMSPVQRLRNLTQLHKHIIGYLWLSFRFSSVFNTRDLAMHVKELVEEQIEAAIAKLRPIDRSKAQRRLMQSMQVDKLDFADEDLAEDTLEDDLAEDTLEDEDSHQNAAEELNLETDESLLEGQDPHHHDLANYQSTDESSASSYANESPNSIATQSYASG